MWLAVAYDTHGSMVMIHRDDNDIDLNKNLWYQNILDTRRTLIIKASSTRHNSENLQRYIDIEQGINT